MAWVRQTSIQAYNDITVKKLLPRQRMAVYVWLYHNGPATASQIEQGLHSKDAHKRTSELRDQGVVQEMGEADCPITGQKAIFWDVTTSAAPRPYINPNLGKTRRQLEEEIHKLRDENSKLRARLEPTPLVEPRQLSLLDQPERVPYQKPKLNFDPRDE
jgi:hypothetical protein